MSEREQMIKARRAEGRRERNRGEGDRLPASASPRRSTSRTQDIDRHVGGRVRERRIMLGLTQQQLADLIGVTYQQAHKYERAINRVSAGRLFEIAQVLSVPVSYFFDGLAQENERGEPARAHVPRAGAQLCPDSERTAPGGVEPTRPRARLPNRTAGVA